MKKFNPLSIIKEEIIGSENTFHAWCILAAVVAILGMGFYLSSPDISFHGIAGSRESNVNFEYPVEIKRVHVIQGQRVQKGDLLIELNQSDLNTKIRQTSAQVQKLKAEKSVRDQMNKAVGNNTKGLAEDPMMVELRDREEELAFLERQRNNLYVFAEIDGIVGSVNYKRGERAPAFASLVTISPDSPTFVQGFVNEQLRTSVQPGSRVRITSLTNTAASLEGKVVSVGARFVEIPQRISLASRGIPLWGREVMVEIPKENNIILGEKVQISPIVSFLPAFVARAGQELAGSAKKDPELIRAKVPPALSEISAFEASGVTYLPDLKKYLVVSDSTDSKDSPWLYLMTEDGEVDERPVVIPGLEKASDLESISADGDYIYVMSSLSLKKGSEEKSRGLLIRAKRNGMLLTGTQTVDLGTLLRKLIRGSTHPLLQALAQDGINSLEIEAQSVRDGALYLGLKAPQSAENSSLLLRVADVNSLFAGKGEEQELEVWKTVKFDATDDSNYRISDMTFVDNSTYFTTTCRDESCGALWSLSENESRPRLIKTFAKDRPEGITYNETKNIFLITFDLGSRGSKLTTINGPRSRK